MQNCVKKLLLCQTYMKFAVAMTSSEIWDITIAISKFPRRVKKSYWKFQPLRVKIKTLALEKP